MDTEIFPGGADDPAEQSFAETFSAIEARQRAEYEAFRQTSRELTAMPPIELGAAIDRTIKLGPHLGRVTAKKNIAY